MQLQEFEKKTQDYILHRCREHLGQMEALLGRPLTFDYRYEHTRTVVAIAGQLAEEIKVDPALARIAAWLHDIAKCWNPDLDEAANWEREKDHGKIGAQEAVAFLRSLDFPPDLTRQVEQAIDQHVGLVKDYILEEPLAALVWDADKLSKVGVAGAIHYLSAQMVMGEDLVDLEKFFGQPEIELHRRIAASFNTQWARQRAEAELEAVASWRQHTLVALRGAELGEKTSL